MKAKAYTTSVVKSHKLRQSVRCILWTLLRLYT